MRPSGDDGDNAAQCCQMVEQPRATAYPTDTVAACHHECEDVATLDYELHGGHCHGTPARVNGAVVHDRCQAKASCVTNEHRSCYLALVESTKWTYNGI